ncbi:DUF4232 domain-containing protein [Nocardia sp. NBC_01503]|uniref:DUF4232 domain-containing protein n=1 Tax=Nocardia sp. NBC_01503 TaxID=2975997 RepID=UPI002E7BF89D|nr:DUF4232 domain-containing protein [Nocardia sp. NBC_01503]WTL32056.1 DUF4232 domain-containing protein [Nocardia sp. NBC_01503]
MRIKSLIVACVAAGLAVTVSGCDPNSTSGSLPTTIPAGQTSQAPTQSGQPTQPGNATESGGGNSETSAVPTTGSPVADPTTSVDTAIPKCVTAQLSLDKGVGGPVGGDWFLRFINNSSRTCVMQGFPGVSQTNGPSGDPVGEPAERDQGPQAPKPVPVVLAPGAAAQFEFITYPKQINDCAALRTNTLRVYPPDNTESQWLPWDSLICPSPQRMLVVRAVTPM